MSIKVLPLAYGYSKSSTATTSETSLPSLQYACGSSTLIQANRTNIIFDTMGPWERRRLEKALAEHKLHPGDIDYVICSHGHSDHIGNINLFHRAKLHIVGNCIYKKDEYFETPFPDFSTMNDSAIEELLCSPEATQYDFKIDDNPDLFVRHTPGHTLECVSLIAWNCDKSHYRVVMAGDLFEREDDLDQESIWIGAGSQNQQYQRKSRKAMLQIASHIVPGHGPMFKAPVNLY